MTVDRLPKAELHCHLEGTMAPALVRRIAADNGIELPEGLVRPNGEAYAWKDFPDFLRAYDAAAGCLRRAADYRDVAYQHLANSAREGALYVEIFTSPDHAATCGLSPAEYLDGIAAGIADAERDHGIVGRLIVTCVRHRGPERALAVAEALVREPHPLVVGFGMGGDETRYQAADFLPAFRVAADAGYPCTVHAGEVLGADSVRAAIDALPVSRIGHGVRAIEDPALVEELARRRIVLEICPGSNLALGLFPDPRHHPFRRFLDAGCRVTLNSDDPPFFNTSIGAEYALAAEHFGLEPPALLEITRTAIEAAFVDADTRARLLLRLEQRASA